MNSKDIMQQAAEEEGWTPATQLELMFQFVDELGDFGKDHLEHFVKERREDVEDK